MEIRTGVTIDDDWLAGFAARHAIRRVAAFGSVLRPDFRADSDIDLLVEFEPGRSPGLLGMAAMELEVGALLGREVDLRTYGDLSPYFRDEVRSAAKELYAA
ncbi:MAG: nucleotidyltransferase family protein [Acidimicrobiia bacterium]|nr:nucleotidyltransferase family protein [Acidimicrobiia bacterium]